MILRWRNDARSSRWTQCNHKGPYKREAEEVRVREAVVTKAGAILRNKRFEDATLLALSPKGPGNKECRWLSDNRKTKQIDSSPEPAQGTRPCTHLDFNSVKLTSDLCPPEL